MTKIKNERDDANTDDMDAKAGQALELLSQFQREAAAAIARSAQEHQAMAEYCGLSQIAQLLALVRDKAEPIAAAGAAASRGDLPTPTLEAERDLDWIDRDALEAELDESAPLRANHSAA